MNEAKKEAPQSQAALLGAIKKLNTLRAELSKTVPGVETFRTEIGVSLDYIAPAFGMTRNGFAPHRATAHTQIKSIDELMERYEFAVNVFETMIGETQPKRARKVRKAWEDNKARYRKLFDDQREAEEWFQSDEEIARWDEREYEHYFTAVLEKVRPVFMLLEKESALKLAYHYEGYTKLNCFSFIGHIAIMTPIAQQKLKHKIDTISNTAEEQFGRLMTNSDIIPHCAAIRYNDYSQGHGSKELAWEKFVNCAKAHTYNDLLVVATLLVCFRIDSVEPCELDMVMTYALCLNMDQQAEMLDIAKKLLTGENIQAPYTVDNIVGLPLGNDNPGFLEVLLGINSLA